ncbi:MAG: hypothetical protein HYZ54_07470 [Ignavibacteriae bacterium]|nr:hypothetical protein [Ignavibacteriota bacterium]
MKTNKTTKKDFDSVAFFCWIKVQIAKELEGKTFKEQKEVLRKYLVGELVLVNSEVK